MQVLKSVLSSLGSFMSADILPYGNASAKPIKQAAEKLGNIPMRETWQGKQNLCSILPNVNFQIQINVYR